ncbi:MAG TPA: DUF2723 domain-containing protein [Candidatus Sulfotelmatobacter sp.]|nr:DUF2723 domain-containing protein [Candidatus Sulfotelmatobacter sp.]
MILSLIRKNILPILLFAFILAIYLHNLSLTVYGGDVGDLVSAASIMGVAHPPGYPLFTLLGFILTRVNFATPAFMVGLISVFSSAIAVVIYYLFILKLTKNKLISLISSLILAFNYLFWLYSEVAEVFALNTLFVVILIFLSYLYFKTNKDKILYVLSLFIGLSLSHHQTIVLIFPSILVFIIPNLKKIISKPKFIFKNILFVLLGLSFYIYVPIAASHNPIINWDNVHDLKSFFHLVLRKDYGTFTAGPFSTPVFAQRVVIVKSYLVYILSQLTLPTIIFSLFGAAYLFLKNKILFLSFFLGFLISGPLFVIYAGFPLLGDFFIGVYERFFVTSTIFILLFFPFGLLFFIEFVNKVFKKKTFQNLFILIFLIIPFSLFYYNFPKTDLHATTIGNDLAYDMLSPLPKGSILFLSGDTVLFNTWYVRYSLNFRPDIKVINLNGLTGDSYFENKLKEYQKLNPKEKLDRDISAKVIKEISQKNPVFSYESVQPSKGEKYTWIPYGLSFQLLNSKEDIPSKENYLKKSLDIWENFRYFKNLNKTDLALGNLTIADIPSVYSSAFLILGNYIYSQYKDGQAAYGFYVKAKNLSPDYYKTYQILGVYFLDKKDCKNASDNLKKSISLNPLDKTSYFLLYAAYKTCLGREDLSKKVTQDYRSIYGTDFFSDAKSELKKLQQK